MSTLHSQVHAHSARSSSRDKNDDAESTQAQLAALRAQVAGQLVAPDREDALYAYVEDALAPLEKGVRRVERRVGRLRVGHKELEASPNGIADGSSKTKSKTVFVPVSPASSSPTRSAFALVTSRFSPPP
jgi:ribosome-associated translation inhibitor RaiA